MNDFQALKWGKLNGNNKFTEKTCTNLTIKKEFVHVFSNE